MFWVYRQTLPESVDLEWLTILEIDIGVYHDTLTATEASLKAYIFADRFLCKQFRRYVNKYAVDMVRADLVFYTDHRYRLATLAFEHIPASRPIIQCIVDVFCPSNDLDDPSHSVSMTQLLHMEKSLPHAFLRRLMQRNGELMNMTEAEEKIKRCYYEHSDGEEADFCHKRHMRFDEEVEYRYFFFF